LLTRRFEMPWRPAYELRAAAVWMAALLFFILQWHSARLPNILGSSLACLCFLLAVIRVRQALKIYFIRSSLSGRAMQRITPRALRGLCPDPQSVFLGFGFEWLPVHSQRMYELQKIDYRSVEVPSLVRRLFDFEAHPQGNEEIGAPYIHGVEPIEVPIYRPLPNFEGGTLVVGTTQSGKGVCLSMLIAQAIYRGDVVIIFDPKNSERLKRNVVRACEDTRESDAFLDFHPAFPEKGVRLDPLFSWQKPTELASRIQSIMPPDTSGSFASFGWDAVNVVVQALVELEDRPNLRKIARYIEGGIEPILDAALKRFFDAHLGPGWAEMGEMERPNKDASDAKHRRPSDRTTSELLARVSYYEQHIPAQAHTKVIDSLVRTFRHNREHYQKITANLLPILSMLTSGDLGRSLSPDPFDPIDVRPIMNIDKVISGGHVLYIALDSLPDPAVASAIAAIFIADLAAAVGMRYNLGGVKRRISLFVDEVSNVINVPLIEILNKGAEGGIYTTCAMQTIADLASRLGNQDRARQALGNLNNLLALRTKDRMTQDFVVETFGKTSIHTLQLGISSGSDAHLGDFSSSIQSRLTEAREEIVPSEILGRLPNLQYFASVSGGRLLKGRFPILDADRHSSHTAPLR